MNLFLYIPAHSAHPPGVLKSLIFGLIQTYHRQNSNEQDFQHNVNKLFGWLLARGHYYDNIFPIFIEAATKIDLKQNMKKRTQNAQIQSSKTSKKNDIYSNDLLFYHMQYHPNDISQKDIHSIYNETCNKDDAMKENFKNIKNYKGGTMKINKLTIAYSRGKNF
jgi:hypothetical protein